MFDDLFHLVASLDHDYPEEGGERVHSYICRCCAIALRLSELKTQVGKLLAETDAAIGDPREEKKN
jgi:hypothetical protein